MAKYRNVTTDFSGGLVTDHILGRVDIERLQKSAKPFTNFFPSLQGPATFRDGFRYSCPAEDTETFAIALSLSDGRSYRVVLSNFLLTVYNSSGEMLDQLDAPYKASELKDIRWSTETDILYLCHGRHAPRTLTVDVQFETSTLLPSDYLTIDVEGIIGVDGLASVDGFTLLAEAVYALGDDSWSLNEVQFTSHPYLTTDLSGTVLSLSNRQEYIRLESSVPNDFDWVVNAANPAAQQEWYVEYFVNNQWSVGKVVNSGTDPDIPDPTGNVLYVDPVDSVVNIEDEACRLLIADRTAASIADTATLDWYKYERVGTDSVNVRASTLVFSPNQINSYLRVGGERLSTDVVVAKDTRTRWYKIKEHRGTEDHPVDFIRGTGANSALEYSSGSVYRAYSPESFEVRSSGGENATVTTTAVVNVVGNRVFAFNYTFAGFVAGVATTVGNLSTQKQFDVVDCYHSTDTAPNNIPEIVENTITYNTEATVNTANGNLLAAKGIISVFDVVTDPEGIASHSATLSASKTLFTPQDAGRFVFAKLGTGYVTLKIESITSATQVDVQVLSSIPKNQLTGKIENNGVFRSFRLGAWYTNNFPQTVAFFEQRRVYGGSYSSPNYIWMSKNEDDTDFRTAENDGDVLDTTGISYPLSNVNATVRWLAPAKALTIGTDNGIYKLTANEYTAAVSPKNVRIELEDPEGAKTPPAYVGSAVFFADISGGRLLEFVYDVNVQATNTNDITKLIYPVFLNDPLIRIEYAHTPQPRIWCLTAGGKLYCLTHHKKEDFYSWCKIEVEGDVKDICVLRKGYLDAGEDQLWITVRNGDRYDYEVMAPFYRDVNDDRDIKSNALFLDSHIRFPASGPAATPIADTLDVSDRYVAGDLVTVITDGSDRGEFTVQAGGVVDVTGLPKEDHVLVGRNYVGLIGMTINTWATALGSSYGAESRVISVRPYVYNSVGYSIGIDGKYEYVSFNKETPEALMEEESTYLLREDGGLILEGVDKIDRFYTGFGKELPVRGSFFGVDKVPTIKHDRPYPLTLVSLVVKTDFNP